MSCTPKAAPPSAQAPLVRIHAPLSKNKLPDLPWAGVALQPGGVGFGEGVVYGPEKRGPTTRRHPRARWSSRGCNGSHGLDREGLRLGRALVAPCSRTLVSSRLLWPPPAASQSKMPGPRVVSTAQPQHTSQHNTATSSQQPLSWSSLV